MMSIGCPHDINHNIAAKLREMVSADHGVVVLAPNIVHARSEFDWILDTRSIFERPIHPADNATSWKSLYGSLIARHLLESCEHSFLVKMLIGQIILGSALKPELSTFDTSRRSMNLFNCTNRAQFFSTTMAADRAEFNVHPDCFLGRSRGFDMAELYRMEP
jgi:hypothetical protein